MQHCQLCFVATADRRTCQPAVRDLVISFGDLHIHTNHMKQVGMQLDRPQRPLPVLVISQQKNLPDYCYDDLELVGYHPHPAIKAEVVV